MTLAHQLYTAAGAAFCLAALVIAVRAGRRFVIARPAYWRLLGRPWRLATFAVALTGITLIAPYTGDPYWDYVDAPVMAACTFITAPWALGVICRAVRNGPTVELLPAIAAWMWSASWSYDLWIVVRDGHYPVTWATNIVASSCLYAFAGFFWSLTWRPGAGVSLVFLRVDWPAEDDASFVRVIWWAVPVMAFIALLMTSSFFGWA